MATGRTVSKWLRLWGNGYPLCGYTQTVGPLVHSFDEVDVTTVCDSAKGYLPGMCSINMGTLVGVFDNTATSGLHALASGANSVWDMLIALGIRAEPAQGDPVFMGKFLQTSYQAAEAGGAVIANAKFTSWDANDRPTYNQPWGVLLHASSAVTAVNSSTGVDGGASSALGGYMMVQVLAGNGTATLKVQHAAVNADGSFADLGGCTTGVVSMATPFAQIYNTTAVTTTVNQFTRWQIVLGTATSVTFLLSFARGR